MFGMMGRLRSCYLGKIEASWWIVMCLLLSWGWSSSCERVDSVSLGDVGAFEGESI